MLSFRGGGGKLSRPVYLDPHPPEYQSKIILLSFLILNYLNVMCINYKHNSSEIQLFSLLDCSIYLVTGVVGGGGVSCPGQFILTPTHLSIKVKLFC